MPQGAARANPAWSLAILPGVGHVPQLEAPQETAAIITEWLGSEGRPAAEAATTARWLPPRMPSGPHRWRRTRHKALPGR